jgi:hypothetical protein
MKRFFISIMMVLMIVPLISAAIPYDAYEAELVEIRAQEDLYYQYIEAEEFGKAYAAYDELENMWTELEVSYLGPVKYLYNAKIAIGDDCASEETKEMFNEAESLYDTNPIAAAEKAHGVYKRAAVECGFDATETVAPEISKRDDAGTDNSLLIIVGIIAVVLIIFIALKFMDVLPCCKACKKADAKKTKKK